MKQAEIKKTYVSVCNRFLRQLKNSTSINQVCSSVEWMKWVVQITNAITYQ